jgi:hypothetical protein
MTLANGTNAALGNVRFSAGYEGEADISRITHAAACCKSIFGNAGSAVVVVERRVREWRGALLAKLAEAGAR